MSKKILACILSFLLFVGLTSCRNTITQSATTTPSNTAPEENDALSYVIVTETCTEPIYGDEDVINIRYPQLRALKDDTRIERINEMIKSYILDENYNRDKSISNPQNSAKDHEVVCYVTTQTPTLLSVVFETDGTLYAEGRNGNHQRNYRSVSAITIDLVNVKKLDLSDFTDVDLPAEEPGFDLYQRIVQSKDVYDRDFKKFLYEDLKFSVYITFNNIRAVLDRFFVIYDSLCYINYTSGAGGYYIFIKILNEAGPYELPKG